MSRTSKLGVTERNLDIAAQNSLAFARAQGRSRAAALHYNARMARGWESKSVESQQDDARAEKMKRPELTLEQRARLHHRQTLELALAHTQAELQAVCRPAHRDMLRLRLEALKAELGTL